MLESNPYEILSLLEEGSAEDAEMIISEAETIEDMFNDDGSWGGALVHIRTHDGMVLIDTLAGHIVADAWMPGDTYLSYHDNVGMRDALEAWYAGDLPR